MRFVDVFAGCGGLSLGLLKSGMSGVFAIEKNPMAFATLEHNLIKGNKFKFDWPDFLPMNAMSCEELLSDFSEELSELAGTIDLVVGGPPCQGFSTAGRRNPSDPRNQMAEQYLKLISILKPTYLVIENVSGFASKFNETKSNEINDRFSKKSYAEFILDSLEGLGYSVSSGLVNCANFGVPQNRYRYLIVCSLKKTKVSIFDELIKHSESFLRAKSLPVERSVSVFEALSDLEIGTKQLVESTDSDRMGFFEIKYAEPDLKSAFLSLMREGAEGAPNSLRLPKHAPNTIVNFKRLQLVSTPGRSVSKSVRDSLGIKKQAITVLAKNQPSPTVTTLPDDIIHYSEARILTVRESARLQSFPDWFEFLGKYTTGGKRRKLDCPRYTQVGNAVPPLLSEAIAQVIKSLDAKNASHRDEKNAAEL
ncbi:DNA cytosine methyltransferase [Pseudomonas lactucae]|uniref:Cytosine-specific methyltransferase n=1 Tax=Pseudomonas lactucae TaxID=2813360 RepID=A0A9X0YB20_9PSED|nr:DNA cytosine methyltransferase [Pseudomonas lactucae]MBN2976664.1 DNA cytosine methyltransferase [Pseudomonas lactucae]MBN2986906.1 DNA cytosine methyltransferase [Pseudomonas lactucae]